MKLLLLIHIVLCVQLGVGQTASRTNDMCDLDVGFKFLVVHDSMRLPRGPGLKTREIWIFMDDRAFSEQNLKKLFTELSKRFTDRTTMDIWVETSWDTTPAPNFDCEGSGVSGDSRDGTSKKYNSALFMRRGEDEQFRYHQAVGDVDKTVVLKGKRF